IELEPDNHTYHFRNAEYWRYKYRKDFSASYEKAFVLNPDNREIQYYYRRYIPGTTKECQEYLKNLEESRKKISEPFPGLP
ncbi:hypothetical protein KY311_04060, partial [Candidatus Woesearchaeota archaeon]|nr:hypothetical protein [Candidatus Woesearchaeota archaeon]